MSLRDAEARAGSFDALRPDLAAGHIMARAEGFYTSEGKPWKREPADGRIPADWWRQLRSVDPAANRATFQRPGFSFVSTDPGDKVKSFKDDITAIGVELERAAVEARWPAKPTIPHAGGQDPVHAWEKAARCVDQHVADHGPLRRHKTGENAGEPIYQHAVYLMLECFKNQGGSVPRERTVQKWVQDNLERCRHW